MAVTALLTLVAAGAPAQTPAAHAAADSVTRPSILVEPESVRLDNYLHDLVGPPALVRVAVGGMLDQVQDKPEAWDEDADGLARRLASRAGRTVVRESVRHGVAALMHRSTEYQPCNCRGFGRRVEHAFLETFTDRRADGSRALSIPRFAGAYAGSFARLAWEPGRDAGDALLGTTMSFGFTAVINIAREVTGLR